MLSIRNLFILFFFSSTHFVFSQSTSATATVNDLINSINVIRVESIQQEFKKDDTLHLSGDVEIFIDHKIHLWADDVYVDKKKRLITARAKEGVVLIETEGMRFTTQYFCIDLATKAAWTEKAKIHFSDGFISAQKIEKKPKKSWTAYDVVYTACDQCSPHWNMAARKVQLNGNFIRASGVLFKVKNIPLFIAPVMVVPLSSESQSGFLIPKLFYDQEMGFGFKEELYLKIAERCDTTLGFLWKERMGLAFYNDFRWAQSSEELARLNMVWARQKNAFFKRDDRIVRAPKNRYWIEGDAFETLHIKKKPIRVLVRADFGTDKRIGYHFFNTAHEVEDRFYTAVAFRHTSDTSVYELLGNTEKTVRSQFIDIPFDDLTLPSDISVKQDKARNDLVGVRETTEKFVVTRPFHGEWHTGFKELMGGIYYSHALMGDYLFSRDMALQRTYFQGTLIDEEQPSPFTKVDTLRCNYKANVEKRVPFQDTTLRVWAAPLLQVRKPIASRGACRLSGSTGVEWALPEKISYHDAASFVHRLQPLLRWEYTPKKQQEHWFAVDNYDRVYPRNEISCAVRSNWLVHDYEIDINFKQKYELYSAHDIFPQRRGVKDQHLLPLSLRCDISHENTLFTFSQEFELRSKSFLELSCNVEYSSSKGDVWIGYLYQDKWLQKTRELYSDIPLFLLAGINFPVTESMRVRYDGQFYARGSSWLAAKSSIRPLVHRLYLEYKGHCWGMWFGFEQKRYRQAGVWHAENAFVVSFSLDTLGAFSGRFKKPLLPGISNVS